MGLCTFEERRHSVRVPHLFSFHFQNKVLKGVDLGEIGIGVFFPGNQREGFLFHREQQLKDCFIEIEGQTIYFSRLRVCWLDLTDDGLVYGLRIESILEPEEKKYRQMYLLALDQYRNSRNLTLAEKQVLDTFASD